MGDLDCGDCDCNCDGCGDCDCDCCCGDCGCDVCACDCLETCCSGETNVVLCCCFFPSSSDGGRAGSGQRVGGSHFCSCCCRSPTRNLPATFPTTTSKPRKNRCKRFWLSCFGGGQDTTKPSPPSSDSKNDTSSVSN